MTIDTTPDPIVGTTAVREDSTNGVIVRRSGHAVSVDWNDGTVGYVSILSLKRAALRHKTTGPQSLNDLITRSCVERHLGLDRKDVARDVLLKLEAIRDGIEPAELTEQDKQRILARLARNDMPPPDAATVAAIRRNLSAQSERDGFEADVTRHVVRLNKRGR